MVCVFFFLLFFFVCLSNSSGFLKEVLLSGFYKLHSLWPESCSVPVQQKAIGKRSPVLISSFAYLVKYGWKPFAGSGGLAQMSSGCSRLLWHPQRPQSRTPGSYTGELGQQCGSAVACILQGGLRRAPWKSSWCHTFKVSQHLVAGTGPRLLPCGLRMWEQDPHPRGQP